MNSSHRQRWRLVTSNTADALSQYRWYVTIFARARINMLPCLVLADTCAYLTPPGAYTIILPDVSDKLATHSSSSASSGGTPSGEHSHLHN